MTNLYLKKQYGAATLIITILVLITITMIVLFAANYGIKQQKITANQYRGHQAFEAAEAGLEYAIPYLTTNRATILANPVSGFIPTFTNSNVTNVTLGNNSKFSIVYTNPIANNYDQILITVTGTSSDNSTTRVVRQLVQYGGLLFRAPTSSVVAQGTVTLTGNTNVINTETNSTIQSASGVTFGGSSQTTISSGTGSTPSNIGSDVHQNDASLGAVSPSDLFSSYFGVSSSIFKSNVANYYTNSNNTNYSAALNNKVNTTIWIDQTGGTATINGNTTIGSPTQPVILIVNGNLTLAGTLDIYGIVYEMGGATVTSALGTVNITGGIVTSGALNLAGTADITFNTTVLDVLISAMGYFAKIPGSWKDF